jgi:hypothetical protein
MVCEAVEGTDNRTQAAVLNAAEHNLTHMPADPDNCEVCAKGKMRRKAAKRKRRKARSKEDPSPATIGGGEANLKWSVTTQYNDLKGIDLVDPGHADAVGNNFLMTVRGDYTGWAESYPIASKNPVHTTDALKLDASRSGGYPTTISTDNGGE